MIDVVAVAAPHIVAVGVVVDVAAAVAVAGDAVVVAAV